MSLKVMLRTFWRKHDKDLAWHTTFWRVCHTSNGSRAAANLLGMALTSIAFVVVGNLTSTDLQMLR